MLRLAQKAWSLAKIIPARQIVPDLDPAIDTIVMKASARDPAHRFQNADEFIAGTPLDAVLSTRRLTVLERTGQRRSCEDDEKTGERKRTQAQIDDG